jgi:quercetin dioxygenase-like cupin family protein
MVDRGIRHEAIAMAMKKKKLIRAAGKTSAMKASKTKAKKAARPLSKVALKSTVPTGKLKAELRHVAWNSVAVDELNPLLGLHYVVGQNIMLARVLLKKGCIVPEHSHANEQVTFVLEGALKFWIDGKEIIVNGGEVLTIPPNMPHRAEALADTVDFDVFNPPRADWMNKTNSYLR